MNKNSSDLSALRKALLTPRNQPVETELLGTRVWIRRRTAGELID